MLEKELNLMIGQRDAANSTLHQALGAIQVLEYLLKELDKKDEVDCGNEHS
jgi:hypothetical protein